MSKKILIILIGFLLFSRAHLVFASPVINEIMYDSDGSDIDWVEIFNPDASDVDLTALKLLIDNSTSNHSINNSSGSSILHQGDYGVIVASADLADYKTKWGNTGNIFTSSFSLPNDAGKIEINDGDKTLPITSVTYNSIQGASGDGNSLQLVSGSWKVAQPTPNAQNKDTSLPPPDNSSSTSGASSGGGSATTASSSSQTPASTKVTEVPKIKTKITSENLSFAGLPVDFLASATGHSGESMQYGKFYWNFGDGDSKEINVNQSVKFTHTYAYPGEYSVSLEYYQNIYSEIPDATNELTVKVVPIDISISSVGDDKDFFVELSNNSSYEADISSWLLNSGTKSFSFPKNTILKAKSKIVLSPKVTGFTVEDKSGLKLMTPEEQVAYDYSLPDVSVVKNINSQKIITPKSTQKVSTKNLTASDLSAAAVESGAKNNSNNYLYLGALAGFLTLVGYVVYFIRKKSFPANSGDEFEILDE